MLEVYEQEGFCGVDGVGDMTQTQYSWFIGALNDRAEREQEAQEKAQRRAQRSH